MPFLKLWNSLRGRANSEPSVQSTAPETTPKACSPEVAKPTPVSRVVSRGMNLFGGGPHSGLCKLLKSVSANSVLEIGVGDGSRAPVVMETLTNGEQKPRYFVIDQFEMAGSSVTLKQFHQSLRAHEIRPQVFPQEIEAGLTRFSHTIGSVDLVIIGADLQDWQNSRVEAKLLRIAHNGTVILYLDGEGWKKHTLSRPVENHRAA
jgi:hypothetical protein